MQNHGVNGEQLSEAFGVRNAPSLCTRVLQKATLTVTELRFDRRRLGRTAPLPYEDAYLIGLQLRPCPDHDLYFDGRFTRPENYDAGVTSIYDLRRNPVADIRDPFHCLMFHLPRTAIDEMACQAGLPRPGDLRHKPGVSVEDPVVRHLLSSLLPLTTRSEEAHSLFLDHVVLAMTAHIAKVYCSMNEGAEKPRSGLASWQERRVKELMRAQFNREIPLSLLANECGLSIRHFARAFRLSAGMPPHRWLLRHRVERAKELLRTRALSLADIAMSCGFADQSHFTRVFTACVGVSPGAWRRAGGIRPE